MLEWANLQIDSVVVQFRLNLFELRPLLINGRKIESIQLRNAVLAWLPFVYAKDLFENFDLLFK